MVILVGVIVAVRSVIGLYNDLKSKPSQPPPEQLDQRVSAIEREIVKLSVWKDQLTAKLEADKLEVLKAGEDRASRMHKRLNSIMVAVVRLQASLNLPLSQHTDPSDDSQSIL